MACRPTYHCPRRDHTRKYRVIRTCIYIEHFFYLISLRKKERRKERNLGHDANVSSMRWYLMCNPKAHDIRFNHGSINRKRDGLQWLRWLLSRVLDLLSVLLTEAL